MTDLLRYLTFLGCAAGLVSCAKLEHLEEALRLKHYSEEKDVQVLAVQEANRRFETLLVMARQGATFTEYSSRESFIEVFGPPVLVSRLGQGESLRQRLLYRRATEYFGGPKVYVFFGPDGRLAQVSVAEPR